MKLRVKKLRVEAALPTRTHEGDAGLDLTVVEGIALPGNCGPIAVSTGLAIEIPDGWAGLIRPRSSTWMRGIDINGTIDSGYRGEVKVMMRNTNNTGIMIQPGHRVAQLILIPIGPWDCVWADELRPSTRGERGFGSSG